MVKKRYRKKTDQSETEKAFQILLHAMQSHPEIESTLWAGACWTALVNGYLKSDIPLKEFKEDWERALKHYSKLWDENDH
jgi:hypothetical protein